MSELHDAAAKGDLKKIEEILAANPNSIKEPDPMNGTLPIVCAAIKGQLEAFKLLFKNGFPTPIDAIDNGKSGMALIHFACVGGCVEIVKLLLNSGFSLDTKTVSGLTVMHSAASGGSKEMMMFLNEKGFSYEVQAKGRTPLEIAAKCDEVEAVKFLLEAGISSKNLLTRERKIVSWCGEKVKKYLQEQGNAKTSLTEQSSSQRPVPQDPYLSLAQRLDELRSKSVIPPVKKSTPTTQTPFPSLQQRIDNFRRNQTTDLPTRVATLEKQVTELATDKQKQQQEIEALKIELKELKDSFIQQQTSTAPKEPQKTSWAPNFNFHHPISSTSPSEPDDNVEILGSNEDANLRTLSFAAVKTEPEEMDIQHKKRPRPIADAEAEMPSPKR